MPLKFVLADAPIVIKWPVYLPEPQDGGSIKKHKITVHYLAEPIEDQRQRWNSYNEARQADENAALKSEDEMLAAVVVGWGEVYDENDQPLEFTPERRDQLLNIRWRRDAVLDGYNAMIKGQKAKN